MIECLNKFCIYQKNNKCILEEIGIENNGTCASCIYIDIPEDILEYEKQKARNSFR